MSCEFFARILVIITLLDCSCLGESCLKLPDFPSMKCFYILCKSLNLCFASASLQQVTQIDNDLKARASAYNNLKGNLQNLERKNA